MNRARRWLHATVVAIASLTTTGAYAEPLNPGQCVAVALKHSAQIGEAAAKVKEYEALLAEVESVYYPKITGLAYLAPMYTVHGNVDHFERKWTSIKDWGPYTHLEAVLAQPLYTFGRAEAGERAAAERVEVERARVREAELAVALEVKKLYYARLFALSMIPALDNAADTVRQALEKAQREYDTGTGEVTHVDLMKLTYGRSEVAKYQYEAQYGAALALSALKHIMGLKESDALELADERLPGLPDADASSLDELLAMAADKRPEWRELTHGRLAAESLAQAEIRAMYPVLFAAGQVNWDWTPMRDRQDNPYVYDVYNRLTGGVAIGLLFDLDPAKAAAKSKGADALLGELEALERFAETGIPLRVRKALGDLQKCRREVELSDDGVKATKKWMVFAAAAYLTGTGEAKDLLEGLVAFLSAKKAFYQTLQDYYVSSAELDFAVGR